MFTKSFYNINIIFSIAIQPVIIDLNMRGYRNNISYKIYSFICYSPFSYCFTTMLRITSFFLE